MDKEKLNDIICESSSDYDILNDAYNYIDNLETQLKKAKETIDKATGFIKTNCSKIGKEYKLLTGNVDYLLEILEDKEVSE